MNAPTQASTQMFSAVWKLLRLRWQINFNSFKHAKKSRKFWTIIGLVGLLVFIGFIFWLSFLLLGFLRSPELTKYVGLEILPFLQAIPTLVFLAMFFGVFLTSFGVLLQALYLSGDMEFLLAAPVPIRAVFISKLLQAVLPSFGIAAVFALPVLFGLGVSGSYNLLYYPLVVLMMVTLTLASAGLSALLVMTVVRIFPARRVAEVLGFVGAITSMICSQSGNLGRSWSDSSEPSSAQLNGLASLVTQLNVPWMPLNWAGRGLVELGEGRWLSGLLLVSLTFGLAVAAFWFALATAERWYYSGWAGIQVVTNKKKTVTASSNGANKVSLIATLSERFLPAPVRGLVRRDFLILTRDLRQVSQLVSPLIFGLLYTFMFFRNGSEPPAGRGDAPGWFMESFRALLVYGNVGMSLFVGWMLLGQLSGTGISREGKNYWLLKASPLRPAHLLAAKFMVAYLPALALGWFFLIGISILQGISLTGFFYGLLVVAMCLAGMNGILLSFGSLSPNFAWEDPRKMNSGNMGCLGSILAAVFLPLSFGLFIGPLWVVAAFQFPMIYGYLAGLVLGISICVTCAWLPLKMVEGRVAKLDEV
ncbi:MAG: ABC transporter permease [Anaerolineae bacterium]|nr:ABC transporter permease [Anaerolineae bacterium]